MEANIIIMGYTKKVIQKKLDIFKCLVHEVKVSEKGNYWGIPIVWDIEKESPVFTLKENRLSKGNFYRDYGKKQAIYQQHPVLLLTKHGALKFKSANKQTFNRFQNLNIKNLQKFTELNGISHKAGVLHSEKKVNEILLKKCYEFGFPYENVELSIHKKPFIRLIEKLIMKGRKSEWVIDRPACQHLPFWRSFNSLGEAKVFLKYEFISDDDFYELINFASEFMFLAATKDKKQRLSLIRHHNAGTARLKLLKDTVKMREQLESVSEEELEEFMIPSSHETLKELHDHYVMELKKQDIEKYSDSEFQIKTDLYSMLEMLGLNFTPIKSHRQLFITGCINNHCISSRSYAMNKDLFISFFEDGEQYDCQFKADKIYEIRGYSNKNAPELLKDKIQEALDLCKPVRELTEKKESSKTLLRAPAYKQTESTLWDIMPAENQVKETSLTSDNQWLEIGTIPVVEPNQIEALDHHAIFDMGDDDLPF